MEKSDIFTSITKYDKPENRFTASLVYLLHKLWDRSKSDETQGRTLCDFFNKLFNASFYLDDDIRIVTQKTEKDEDEEGMIPDFQISSQNTLVWVEVKDEAPFSQKLEQYKQGLEKKARAAGYKEWKLVLLRHHYVSKEETEGIVDNDVTWDRLHTLLKEVEASTAFSGDSLHSYLLSEFSRYLAEKGVTIVETIGGEAIKTGFVHIVGLLMLIEDEATEMFQDNELWLHVSKTEVGYYDGSYVEFNFDEGHSEKKGYSVGLWGPEKGYPFGSVFLKAKSAYLEEKEEKRIVEENVPQSDSFWQEDDRTVYLRRPLTSVFVKKNGQEQRQEIGRLLREMYNDLEQAIEDISERRGNHQY